MNHFFSGSNSPFFSLSYNANPKLEIIAEMSSDDYDMEVSSSERVSNEKVTSISHLNIKWHQIFLLWEN